MEQWLDQQRSFNFIYFINSDINIFIESTGGEVISSDRFILNKYIMRSSLNIINTYNNIVVRSLFLKSVPGYIEVRLNSETMGFYTHNNCKFT